ncbi:MAG: hypothetical protein AAF432_00485 [Planctomycetota bacterium]
MRIARIELAYRRERNAECDADARRREPESTEAIPARRRTDYLLRFVELSVPARFRGGFFHDLYEDIECMRANEYSEWHVRYAAAMQIAIAAAVTIPTRLCGILGGVAGLFRAGGS